MAPDLERAILETLAYSDIFDYPLRLAELHRYLTAPASVEELLACLSEIDFIESEDGFYFLQGRANIVPLRLHREQLASGPYRRAVRYGRVLGKLPFIRMVALTGSLALRNCDETGDYDYMLVAKTGRVWLARAFALVLNRITRLFGETLCPNLIISERALLWNDHNLYSAREICQMIPISGGQVYQSLRVANVWVDEFLPNASLHVSQPEPVPTARVSEAKSLTSFPQRILEFSLLGRFGDVLEAWEMKRKIERFTHQSGYGPETAFTADICQGNFDHHGRWTMQKYHERLLTLGIHASLPKLGKRPEVTAH